MNAPSSAPALGSLLHKAAVDAGFDLEPEVEGAWWRLRASGVPGLAWLYPLPGGGAALALPAGATLAEVATAGAQPADAGAPAPPPGAAGAVACPSPYVVHAALRRVWTLRVHSPARLRARWEEEVAAALGPTPEPDLPVTTEVVSEVRRRVGQNLYREALLDWWEGRCAVTGLAVPELLRASHAKPWAVATDAERLDVHNGLLLAIHLDALFDRGYLTFDDTGRGILSQSLSGDAASILGIGTGPVMINGLVPAHHPYLAWHRTHVFRA